MNEDDESGKPALMERRPEESDDLMERHRQCQTRYRADLRNRDTKESIPLPVISRTTLKESRDSLRAPW